MTVFYIFASVHTVIINSKKINLLKLTFYLTIPIALSVLTGCSSLNAWSEEQQNAFFSTCYKGTAENFDPDDAEAYCKCMLEHIMEIYPDPESIDAISEEEMDKYARNCLP